MNTIKKDVQSVKAFAPATCANVVVGYDILGFAFNDIGDQVTLTKRQDNKIVIETIDAKEALPEETAKNTASYVIQKICEGLDLSCGFTIGIEKGIPLSSGMGGSAASAVAALTAFNAFLELPLSLDELASYAALGEALVSGEAHADNVVPSLFGGLSLIHSVQPLRVIKLPLPDVYYVLVHPHLQVATKEARSVLKPDISLQNYVKQSANLAAFIASLYEHDISIMQKSMTDILIEPQRAQFVPGFYEIQKAALQAGALAMSFSGSGPSLIALAKNEIEAKSIAHVMQAQLQNLSIKSDLWISRMKNNPAHVTSII